MMVNSSAYKAPYKPVVIKHKQSGVVIMWSAVADGRHSPMGVLDSITTALTTHSLDTVYHAVFST